MNVTLHLDGMPVTLAEVSRTGQALRFTHAGVAYHFRSHRLPDGSMVLEQEIAPGVWRRQVGASWQAGKDRTRVQVGGQEAYITEMPAHTIGGAENAPLSPTAPMPGLVRQLLVAVGDRVTKGQPLAVMEAMKLQLTLAAGDDATVEAWLVKEGDMIAEGAELVRLKPGKP